MNTIKEALEKTIEALEKTISRVETWQANSKADLAMYKKDEELPEEAQLWKGRHAELIAITRAHENTCDLMLLLYNKDYKDLIGQAKKVLEGEI